MAKPYQGWPYPDQGILDVVAAIRTALADIGFVGEVRVRIGGSGSTSWIGQPSEDDKICTVVVTDPEPNASVRAERSDHG